MFTEGASADRAFPIHLPQHRWRVVFCPVGGETHFKGWLCSLDTLQRPVYSLTLLL